MKVAIAAGGTGGHVFPALAVAERLMQRGHQVVWLGTHAGFEARMLATRPDIPARWITIGGVRGKGLATLIAAPLRIVRAVWQSLRLLADEQPAVLLGMGGFVAGPTGLAARLTRRALVIHEQNAAAGLTNRLLARVATTTLQAYPGALPAAETVGNPVRAAFFDLPAPDERIAQRAEAGVVRLLVVGGSLGARALNEQVPAALAHLPAATRPQVLHQGGRTVEAARRAYAAAGVDADIREFIDDIPAAYGAADVVVCRAGALTVAELAAAGCPAILVPFPFAVDDHQTANAAYLADAGAAVLIAESELTPQRLAEALQPLLSSAERRMDMARRARRQAWPAACDAIVDACLQAGEAA